MSASVTKDEILEELARKKATYVWEDVVEFVSDWIENQGDEYGNGILPIEAAALAARFRETLA